MELVNLVALIGGLFVVKLISISLYGGYGEESGENEASSTPQRSTNSESLETYSAIDQPASGVCRACGTETIVSTHTVRTASPDSPAYNPPPSMYDS